MKVSKYNDVVWVYTMGLTSACLLGTSKGSIIQNLAHLTDSSLSD